MVKNFIRTGFFSALMFCGFGLNSQAQTVLFSEDFNNVPNTTLLSPDSYSLPAGWQVFNLDGYTPYYTFVNQAWIRTDYNGNDTGIVSTSYYGGPSETSNDWIWTPAINVGSTPIKVSWSAFATDGSFPDGYEVRIMSSNVVAGGPTSANVMSSTVLFSTTGENSSITFRDFVTSNYSNQTIWIAFRNNSAYKDLLVIDNVEVSEVPPYDAVTQNVRFGEYTIMPHTQIQPLQLGARITNSGTSALTNVNCHFQIKNSAGVIVQTISSNPVANIAAGAFSNFQFPTWTPPATPDVYTVKVYSTKNELDGIVSNDTVYKTFEVNNVLFGRAEMNFTNGLSIGVGSGETGYLGHVFNMPVAGRIDSITTYFSEVYTGTNVRLKVFAVNGSGVPTGNPIATTTTFNVANDYSSLTKITLPISTGPWAFAAGKYFVAFEEDYSSDYSIATTKSIFTTNTGFVKFPSGLTTGFDALEAYGAGFEVALGIYPHVIGQCQVQMIDSVNTLITDAACGTSTGSIDLAMLGNNAYTYSWTNLANTQDITNLSAGNYTVTVFDPISLCSQSKTFAVANLGAPIAAPVITDAKCKSGNGKIALNITGGTAPYNVMWTHGATTDTISAAAGIYFAIITDANGCSGNSGYITINEPNALTSTISSTNATCPTCSDATVTVTAAGGTLPYSYSWTPAGSTDVLTGVAAGTYSVVVTDANGCTSTSQTTVLADSVSNPTDPNTSNEEFGVENAIVVYPNPSNGSFNVSLNLGLTGKANLEIMDISGRVIYTSTLNILSSSTSNQTVELTNLVPGTYVLMVKAENTIYTKKLVIK